MDNLSGSTVVIIGGTSGIGLETARRAHAAEAKLVLTGRNQERLGAARDELGASTATLDLGDSTALQGFFAELPVPVDHVLVSGGGPFYSPIAELDFDRALGVLDEHLLGSLRIARECATRVRAGGSLTFITGTHARRPGVGLSLACAGMMSAPSRTRCCLRDQPRVRGGRRWNTAAPRTSTWDQPRVQSGSVAFPQVSGSEHRPARVGGIMPGTGGRRRAVPPRRTRALRAARSALRAGPA